MSKVLISFILLFILSSCSNNGKIKAKKFKGDIDKYKQGKSRYLNDLFYGSDIDRIDYEIGKPFQIKYDTIEGNIYSEILTCIQYDKKIKCCVIDDSAQIQINISSEWRFHLLNGYVEMVEPYLIKFSYPLDKLRNRKVFGCFN